MPPKSKMSTKVCPDCDNPCAVACKTCVCGYSFYHAKRSDGASASASAGDTEQEGVRQRRTQRIKEKPNFYDATEFMKEKRKRRRRNEDQYELRRGGEPAAASSSGALKRRKRRKGGRGAPKEEEEEEEVLPIGIAPAKTAQCAIILADLNRRIQSTAVRVR